MTALTHDRRTPRMESDLHAFPVAAGVTIYAGALVVLDAGYARPGRAQPGLVAFGRAEERVDNTDGIAGERMVTLRRGVFRFANDAGDSVRAGDAGWPCYIVDDQTVARTDAGGTRPVAGKVRLVDALGVWVELTERGLKP